jgi:hypothetical protein
MNAKKNSLIKNAVPSTVFSMFRIHPDKENPLDRVRARCAEASKNEEARNIPQMENSSSKCVPGLRI